MTDLAKQAAQISKDQINKLAKAGVAVITDDDLQDWTEPEAEAGIYSAEYYRADLYVLNPEPQGDRLPWNKASDMHFRKGELTIWTGFNGHRKSMVLGQAVLGFLAQNKKVCVASPEMMPKQTLRRMIKQYAGTADVHESITDRFFQACKGKLWVYDPKNGIKPKQLIQVIKYSANLMGVNHFVIDSLMKCGINEDDLNTQKWFVDELTNVAKRYDIHIHLVAHQRKSMAGDSKPGTKSGVAGSANITNLASNVINVYQDESDGRLWDNALYIQKQRNYEGDSEPHPSYFFWFDSKSLQFLEKDGIEPWQPPDWSIWGHKIKKEER